MKNNSIIIKPNLTPARILIALFFVLLLLPIQAIASTASYIYDDLGRLSRVIDDQGNVATYNYDEVGNLISITSSTKAQLLPQITSINPNFVRAGSSSSVTIAGSNLLGSSLSTDNPGIEIIGIKIQDTTITATLSVSQAARQGTTVVTVTNPIGSASINISVYPPSPVPTISPSVKVVQPNGGTGTMTIALTNPDIFPTTITLNIANLSVATVSPAQVIIPAGETQATITITGNTPGLTTITASTGTGTTSATINTAGPLVGANFVYSNQVGIILKTPPTPPKLVAREPILSPMVGVKLEAPPPQPSSKTFGPVQAAPVGIAFGPTITSISPNRGAIGSSNLEVIVKGANLEGTTSVAFQPNTGITTNSTPSVSPDGSSVTVSVSIALTAPQVARTVAVTTPSGLARPAQIGANIFTVTPPPPEIISIIPIQAQVGTISTLSVNGRNLSGATSIDFIPNTGIVVGNPPSINSTGTLATVNVSIAPNAPVGQRVVTITTAGGTTTDVASAANTFTITSTPGTTFTPLLSPQIGIVLETAPVSKPPQTLSPVQAAPVGIAFGPTIRSITPNRGAIGSNNLIVSINGANLEGTSQVSFQPSTGITINGAPIVSPDGNSVTVDISLSSTAPLGARTITVNTISGLAKPSTPFADIFTVTLPPPEIASIMPITGALGTSLTLTINGKDLSGATSVNFIPDTGIFVGNPPSVSADGTQATVSVSIASNAPVGQRVVTITTPGGTTTSTASPANTFTITQTPGTTFTPILSPLIGVTIQTAPPPISTTFTPVMSSGVGVDLAKTPLPAAPITISPILAPSVGAAFGPTITGIDPKAGSPGTVNIKLTIRGANLTGATGVNIFPSTGITVGSMAVASDGSSIDVTISIASDASLGPRTIAVNTPAGGILPSTPGANIFQVATMPEIFSIIPIQQTVGATFTLTINGINLNGATQVSFIPGDGISVGNPPSVNVDGTLATVQVSISSLVTPGPRVVTITTLTGTSDTTATSSNTFTVIGVVTSQIDLELDQPIIIEDHSISPPASNEIVSFDLPSAERSNGDHREAERSMPYPMGLPAGTVTPRLVPISQMRGILNNTISGYRGTSADIKQGGSYKTATHNNHSYAIKDDALKVIRLISLIRPQRPRSPTASM